VSGPPVIALDGVTRRFGSVTAVASVSFEVRRGEMLGLIGPDGAGKTTVLRLVLGLLRPHAGRVVTCGVDPVRRRTEITGRVGYLSQRFSLYGDLTVDENVAFFAEIHGMRDWQGRRSDLLEMVRMTPFRARLAERLSGGMKQKLALACTLIHTPEILVLDEPTAGVDPVSRREFWKLLAGLSREGLTVLMTTPYLDEAERCSRVALMDRGRLLSVDTPVGLRKQAGGVVVELLARPRREAALRLREIAGVTGVQTFGERLHAAVSGLTAVEERDAAARIAPALRAAGVEVESARVLPPSMEDVFIARVLSEASSRPE
jgi:ABC-2 type transport system ATP-binding protein